MKGLLSGALALFAGCAAAQGVYLAPGRTLTILDAADPSVRVVLTAPADTPLDLSTLLIAGPKDSVSSIVTRLQVESAGVLARNPDGSVSLDAKSPAQNPQGRMLQGGVLVFTDGKYVYHPENEARSAAAPAAGVPSAPQAQRGRLLISKRGATQAQAERDIARCRAYADAAAAQFMRSADRVESYNNAMHGCLKSFGYEIHVPRA